MKSLIIYFSHAGENWSNGGIKNLSKGNTEIIAEKIQKKTNSDIFKVEELNPYPYNYKECCERAKEELDSNARPEIKESLNDINDYDLIYIGSPVWYSHMPMVMFTGLEKLNFDNKRIKLFVTHEGSALGQTKADIEKLCKNAILEQAITINGSKTNEEKDFILEMSDFCE